MGEGTAVSGRLVSRIHAIALRMRERVSSWL